MTVRHEKNGRDETRRAMLGLHPRAKSEHSLGGREQSRTEQSRTEQSRAEQSRAEKSKSSKTRVRERGNGRCARPSLSSSPRTKTKTTDLKLLLS